MARARVTAALAAFLLRVVFAYETACVPSVVHPSPVVENAPMCDYVVWLSFTRDDVSIGGGSGGATTVPAPVPTFVARTVSELSDWSSRTTATAAIAMLRWRTRLYSRPQRTLHCRGYAVDSAVPAWDIVAAPAGRWNVVVSKLGLCVSKTRYIAGASTRTPSDDVALVPTDTTLHGMCNIGVSMALRSSGTFMDTNAFTRFAAADGVRCVTAPTSGGGLAPAFLIDVFASPLPPSSMPRYGQFGSTAQIAHSPWGCIGSLHNSRHHHHRQTVDGDDVSAYEDDDDGEQDIDFKAQLEVGWLLRCSATSYAVHGVGACVTARVLSILLTLASIYQTIGCAMPWTTILVAIPVGLSTGPWWITLRILLGVGVRLYARCCVSGCVQSCARMPQYKRRTDLKDDAHKDRDRDRDRDTQSGAQYEVSSSSNATFLQTVSVQRLSYEDKTTVLLTAFATLYICANKVGDVAVLVCAWLLAVHAARFRVSRIRYMITAGATAFCCIVRIVEILETVLMCLVIVAWNVTPAIQSLFPGSPFAAELGVLLVFVIVPFAASVRQGTAR